MLERDYELYMESRKKYEDAKAKQDSESMNAARNEFNELEKNMDLEYRNVFRKYKNARDRGNMWVDIDDCSPGEIPDMVKKFKKYGIDFFTFSSTWSSAVENAWAFQSNGCTPIGLIEIHSSCKSWGTDKYDTVHAWLFKVN